MQLFQLEERLRGVASWAGAEPWTAVCGGLGAVDPSGGCPQDEQVDQETGEHYPRDGYPARSMSLGPPRSWPEAATKGPRGPRPQLPPQQQQYRNEPSVPPPTSTWCCFPQKKSQRMLRAKGPHYKVMPECVAASRLYSITSATGHASSCCFGQLRPISVPSCPHWLFICFQHHRPLSDRAWCRVDAKRMTRLDAAARRPR
mgnify:CR=1 FL=1